MIPGWLPEVAVTYLAHTAAGLPLRALARARGCHASTVLRQIRRVEAWRDDPLIDEALERMARDHAAESLPNSAVSKELPPCRNPAVQARRRPDPRIEREARRILRRLCEKGAFLAVAPSMEKAVVLREVVPGRQNRIAVVDRDVAHAFALQEWIGCEKAGKIACYTHHRGRAGGAEAAADRGAGRARAPRRTGFAEAQAPFQEQHRFFAERTVMAEDGSGERRLRFNLAESPLSVLGRKRDKDGAAYLTAELIEAGERLREDFELAQMGPRVAQNWERFLTAGGARGAIAGPRPGRGAAGRAGPRRQGDGGAGAGALGHRLPDLLLPRRAGDRREAARLVGALGQGGAEDRARAAGGALRHRRRARSGRRADAAAVNRCAGGPGASAARTAAPWPRRPSPASPPSPASSAGRGDLAGRAKALAATPLAGRDGPPRRGDRAPLHPSRPRRGTTRSRSSGRWRRWPSPTPG